MERDKSICFEESRGGVVLYLSLFGLRTAAEATFSHVCIIQERVSGHFHIPHVGVYGEVAEYILLVIIKLAAPFERLHEVEEICLGMAVELVELPGDDGGACQEGVGLLRACRIPIASRGPSG